MNMSDTSSVMEGDGSGSSRTGEKRNLLVQRHVSFRVFLSPHLQDSSNPNITRNFVLRPSVQALVHLCSYEQYSCFQPSNRSAACTQLGDFSAPLTQLLLNAA